MSIVRWQPLHELEDFFNIMPRHFSLFEPDLFKEKNWRPSCDIEETESAFVIKADLPGLEREDIKVSVDQGMLTISGERKQEEKTEDAKSHRVERFYGLFNRSFRLPENCSQEDVQAAFEKGVLTLTLPKVEVAEPTARHIEIR